ncbi:MAG TPA: DUF4465 domain-containing protein [Flavipsychrobacter sp.]|nr:DUF4465 domain-containing protein [Flavipsychrobacter sp.]
MRKLLLATALMMSMFSAKAQVVATFDTFSLLTTYPDTAYIDYSQPLADIGFNYGAAYFPCAYDTAFGGSWLGGFSYSNMTDSVTHDYHNDHSAYTATGYNNSLGYCVVFMGYAAAPYIKLHDTSAAGDSVLGFYITNTTYGYKTVRDGYFSATPFGGTSGNDSDWFRLVVYGYNNGVMKPDSVEFFLADYRFSNNTQDYIVDDWQWLDLTALGGVDSITFAMSSSDTNQFGMLTPAYFAMDNFTTKDAPTSVGNAYKRTAAKMYPNPAADLLYVEVNNPAVKQLRVLDITGREVLSHQVRGSKEAINISSLPAGTYYLQMSGEQVNVGSRFVKQ